jgi:ubiquinone/menaquinone biosynthesis C-methylase UbiE
MKSLSKNEQEMIDLYNADIRAMNGYVYTGRDTKPSMVIFNKRASLAIEKLVDLRGKTVLDIGCGDGTYSAELYQSFGAKTVVGLEPSNAWKLATEKHSALSPMVTFQQGSVYELPFDDNAFDFAVLRFVLHHLDEPLKAIEEVTRVSRNTVVLEPNGYNLIVKIIAKLSPYHRAHKEKSFAAHTIKKWFAQNRSILYNERFSSLVPLFCPSFCVGFLDWLSQRWEWIPFIPTISCGLYGAAFKKVNA